LNTNYYHRLELLLHVLYLAAGDKGMILVRHLLGLGSEPLLVLLRNGR
jgi:hypothetical protein